MASGSGDSFTLEIDIDGETEIHSLLSAPNPSSKLVLAHKGSLAGSLDLEKLVEYIGHVGKFIKIAYNGINAAGPRFTDLQIKVQSLGYDITKLCNNSSVTIDSFRGTAETVSYRLQTVYQFLLDGYDSAALKSLTSLGKMAEKMAKLASELEGKFEEQGDRVKYTLEETMKRRGEEKIYKDEIMKRKERMEREKKLQEELAERHYKLAEEARQEKLKYEEKEIKEIDGHQVSGVLRVFAAVLTVALPFASESIDGALNKEKRASDERAKRYGDKAREKAEIEEQKRQSHLEALQKMSEFASMIEELKTDGDMADVAIQSLHEAAGALRHLSVVMMEAAKFWKHIQKHCESLSEGFLAELIEDAKGMSVEEKKAHWRSKGFIREAVLYHARWIALHDVCKTYQKQIDLTRADLYEYITDNPDYKESKERLPILAREFIAIINEAKKRIEQERSQAN
uniref:Uncharacterized protein n=1 Tax=Amphimedon queenslandica TaxID=400682 RepID=A0A1X7TI85_AMPQE